MSCLVWSKYMVYAQNQLLLCIFSDFLKVSEGCVVCQLKLRVRVHVTVDICRQFASFLRMTQKIIKEETKQDIEFST